MGSPNALKIALQIAEEKYGDNLAVQSLVKQFTQAHQLFKMERAYPIEVALSLYNKALEGQDGYSLFLGKDTIQSAMGDTANSLIKLAVVQTKAECLIMALQDLGEEIEY